MQGGSNLHSTEQTQTPSKRFELPPLDPKIRITSNDDGARYFTEPLVDMAIDSGKIPSEDRDAAIAKLAENCPGGHPHVIAIAVEADGTISSARYVDNAHRNDRGSHAGIVVHFK